VSSSFMAFLFHTG